MIKISKYERQRNSKLNKIEKDKKITHCYIRKGAYYRPNSSGYTDFLHMAGVFTKEEALKSARHCIDISLVPIDITEHNAMILEKIMDLSTRLIK